MKSKLSYLLVANLSFGLMMAPKGAFAGGVTAAVDAVKAAKTTDAAIDAGKAIRFSVNYDQSLEYLRKSGLPRDVVRAKLIEHLQKESPIRSMGLSQNEVDELASQILSAENATGGLTMIAQRFAIRRLILQGRSPNGAVLYCKPTRVGWSHMPGSKDAYDPTVTRMERSRYEQWSKQEAYTVQEFRRRMEEMGIKVEYWGGGVTTPPSMRIYFQGDEQTLAVLKELEELPVEIGISKATTDAEKFKFVSQLEEERTELLAKLGALDERMGKLRATDQALKPGTADIGERLKKSEAVVSKSASGD